MTSKFSIPSLILAAMLGSTALASAQSGGAAAPGAATIPGDEVRANESPRTTTAPDATTGVASPRPVDQTAREIETDRRLPQRTAPDATQAAPAGR